MKIQKFVEFLDEEREKEKNNSFYFEAFYDENIVVISAIDKIFETLDSDDVKIIFNLEKEKIDYIDFSVNLFNETIIEKLAKNDKKNFEKFYNRIEKICNKILKRK